jgi:hypothetical protein
MCSRVKELQLSHTLYEAGDFFYEGLDPLTQRPRFSVAGAEQDGKERTIGSLKAVWLPRQDQLQAMLGNYRTQCNLIYQRSMKEVMMDAMNPGPASNSSMEQLWLTIVMKEKYGKLWRNNEWVRG